MLAKLIYDNLTPAARTVRTLRGGLILIFYPREATYLRIVAAREAIAPSDRELDVLRREIKTAVADQPLVTVGNFERLEPKDGFQAAEIWINFAPVTNHLERGQ